MKPKLFLSGALVGGLITAPLIVLLYLGNQILDLAFVPFDVFDWMARLLPGPVITFGIDLMIDTLRFLNINVANSAKTAEQAMALAQYLGMGIVAGAVFFAMLRSQKVEANLAAGIVLGALFGFPAIAISLGESSKTYLLFDFLWLLLLFFSWGVVLTRIYVRLSQYEIASALATPESAEAPATVQKIDRRTFLIYLGAGAATITVVGAGLGALLSSREQGEDDSMAHDTEGPEGLPFPNANAAVIPVPGTRPEYTPVKDHYQVFLELEPTEIEGSTWKLPITGMVDTPLMLSLDDIRDNYPSRDQYVTLSCISGRIGTSLISTTYWTGVSAQDVLADAGIQEGARYLYISSGDGFYESIPIDLINADPRIMFCYAWDGNTLPVGHGFPLRIWIPDRYGMKQPKWITSIEVTDTYKEGYWVERNWDETAQVRTTSVIDTVAVEHIVEREGQRYIPVGGIAFSGDRGISKVEVRVDGGDWEPAQLRTPLSETTWVIWRYEWPFQRGDHTFEVRCYEADGELQVQEINESRPSGATGIHSVSETI